MNHIEIDGKSLRVVNFTNNLYRADCTTYRVNSLASNDYRDAPMKYFTLNKEETHAYSRRGFPYIKTWQPIQNLVLIDIFHTPTRDALKELIGADAINIAFPKHHNGFIYRVSEENTKNKNDDVLRSICELGRFDGYYMRRQDRHPNKRVGAFHSEVGLCPSAYRKIRLTNVKRDLEAPPCIRNRLGGPRKTVKNNNNTRNNNKSYNKEYNRRKFNITKVAPVSKFSLF
jgi:hypothetical protein